MKPALLILLFIMIVPKGSHAEDVLVELRDVQITKGTKYNRSRCIFTGHAVAEKPVKIRVNARTGGASTGKTTVIVNRPALAGHFYSEDFQIALKFQCANPKIKIDKRSIKLLR